MRRLILSGVGGSTNWLPLIFPLAAIVAVLYIITFAIKFIRKKKLEHEQKLIQQLPTQHDSETTISEPE